MGGIGDAIGEALVKIAILLVIATASITTLLIYGVPWVWSYIKPWLHSITG